MGNIDILENRLQKYKNYKPFWYASDLYTITNSYYLVVKDINLPLKYNKIIPDLIKSKELSNLLIVIEILVKYDLNKK